MHTLILLTKYPTPGNVKTRLGKGIGMERSALFQRRCLEKLIATHTNQHQYQLLIGLREPEMVDKFCNEFSVLPDSIFIQQGDDLGAIMHHALTYGLSMGRVTSLIGSDAPLITPDHIVQAYSTLIRHDIVLGPSDDGGYYLIGSKEPLPEIITGMTYSTDTVLEETCTRCDHYGKRYGLLEHMIDVDTIAAWRQGIQDDTTGRLQSVAEELGVEEILESTI